jgi:hypothetical protein
MTWFYTAIDLTENLDRGLLAIRGVRGTTAFVLALALLLICCGIAPLVWYLDIDATLAWVEPTTQQIMPTLPGAVLPYLSALVLVITFLPSLIELFTARFAAHIPAAGALVFAFTLFDAVTDYPRVAALLAQYESAYAALWIFGIPLYWLSHPLLLFMASLGFELLLIVFTILALVLLMNARTDASVSTRRRGYRSRS